MSGRKQTVRDIGLSGKAVLVRVDFNLPFKPGTTEISDDSRIRATIPTLEYLLQQDCKLVLCSHLGRPKGSVVKELRLEPITRRLEGLVGRHVVQAGDCVGDVATQAVASAGRGDLVMLENLRFHPGEEANDSGFAAALASHGEVFVNDAFGAAHRAHASTEGVTRYLPSVAGLLMDSELEALGGIMESPRHPFVVVLGGAKVSDKVGVIDKLLPTANTLLIGGGMAATFLKGLGKEIGDSLLEDDLVDFTADLLKKAESLGVRCLLPTDVVLGNAFAAGARHRTVKSDEIAAGWRVLDIGPETSAAFETSLAGAKTVLWNGPMGVFEFPAFAEGTARVGQAIADLEEAATVVGGGSTAEAVTSLGLASMMTHVSTGGGASLEFLEGKQLPGVAALMDAD